MKLPYANFIVVARPQARSCHIGTLNACRCTGATAAKHAGMTVSFAPPLHPQVRRFPHL
jgi:hypothetical protein